METSILVFVLVGFIAQMIDGALGMAYGVSSNTFLLSLGIPPAAASASVHMAEVVTTGIPGFSHWRLGNVDWKLVRRLLLPGVIGGGLAAPLAARVTKGIPVKRLMILVGILIILLSIRTIYLAVV